MRAIDRWKRLIAGLLVVAVLIGADQYSKMFAVTTLKNQPDIVWIPGIFRLVYVENYGAAFGIRSASILLLILLTAVLVIYIFSVYVKLLARPGYRLLRAILLGVVAGGIGNIIDRLLRGYVIDFFYFELIDFPVFNLADCYITCSVAALLICMFTVYKNEDISILYPF